MIADTTHDTELVPENDAFPSCGERDMDRLVWIDDERVGRQRCKRVYPPGDTADDD